MSETTYDLTPSGPARAGAAGDVIELSVVIPAYNEETRLLATLDAVRHHLNGYRLRWELIVVDDGSTDRTAWIAATRAARERRIVLVRSAANRGKGHAVRAGVRVSRGRQVLVCDADLATPIEELAVLRAALATGADAAIGSRAHCASRITVRQNVARRMLGRAGNRLIQVLATPGIADTQCGFKLFDGAKARTAFDLATVDGWGFDVEILYLFRRFGWVVEEMPVCWAHQPGSKLRPGGYLTTIAEVVRMRRAHGRRPRPAGSRDAARPVAARLTGPSVATEHGRPAA
ncbi:dolichyl-phosphate beta-glucosyltransferase [Actinomadura hibisca]|uniref:dolichyl-phosphate beta-glucosyltransferase n=1 Tax=Actinomadura hibisca TaxID=68565 RepID=UPI00082B43FD|nr:dolichyl-phosphate beta-glucosyltransferase [Actinomadura hibisca]